jgi:nitrate/nitrite transporter NarK
MIFIFGTLPLFWSIAMARMSGLMAAAGLAFINMIGLIGGFIGPYLFGLAETATGNPSAGFYVVIASSIICVLLAPLLHIALRREDTAAAALRNAENTTTGTTANETTAGRNGGR